MMMMMAALLMLGVTNITTKQSLYICDIQIDFRSLALLLNVTEYSNWLNWNLISLHVNTLCYFVLFWRHIAGLDAFEKLLIVRIDIVNHADFLVMDAESGTRLGAAKPMKPDAWYLRLNAPFRIFSASDERENSY